MSEEVVTKKIISNRTIIIGVLIFVVVVIIVIVWSKHNKPASPPQLSPNPSPDVDDLLRQLSMEKTRSHIIVKYRLFADPSIIANAHPSTKNGIIQAYSIYKRVTGGGFATGDEIKVLDNATNLVMNQPVPQPATTTVAQPVAQPVAPTATHTATIEEIPQEEEKPAPKKVAKPGRKKKEKEPEAPIESVD
jgi:hypothetical protein